jgi:hypothetical protein
MHQPSGVVMMGPYADQYVRLAKHVDAACAEAGMSFSQLLVEAGICASNEANALAEAMHEDCGSILFRSLVEPWQRAKLASLIRPIKDGAVARNGQENLRAELFAIGAPDPATWEATTLKLADLLRSTARGGGGAFYVYTKTVQTSIALEKWAKFEGLSVTLGCPTDGKRWAELVWLSGEHQITTLHAVIEADGSLVINTSESASTNGHQ